MGSGTQLGTFVFTDIEGSTRLLRELGERYVDVLAQHRDQLREAFAAHAGAEIDTQGDAFFYVFPSADRAVAAATSAQLSLRASPVAVRMGIHSGSAIPSAQGYVGLDVHLAARITAAGHGGQVLISRATFDEAGTDDVIDLGEHKLKDFDRPIWIFQLGQETFPPLKTISSTNLPRPASSFIGRDKEVRDVVSLVRSSRLVTLSGPGGSGKTRVAIEAASEFVGVTRNGVFWIELSEVRDHVDVVGAISATLGASGDLATEIGSRAMLLVLDNFEHVIHAATAVATIVEMCPGLRVLVTSREKLRVRGEIEYRIDPLGAADAVQFFCGRAGVDADRVVERLCAELDNMPLALELAAARADVLTPDQILARVSKRLDLFKGGRDADPRQASLRATIEWSHDLLASEEQRLFARLAVFSNGCTLEAAEVVCDAQLDDLGSLVAKNLVRHSGDRFSMLETIRSYAGERLAELSERDTLRQRVADWVLDWAGTLDFRGARQAEFLSQLRIELPNVQLAVDELHASGRHDRELALASMLAQPMFQLGRGQESQRWLKNALDCCPDCPTPLRVRGLAFASIQSTFIGDAAAAAQQLEQALAMHEPGQDEELTADLLLAQSVQQSDSPDFGKEMIATALTCVRALGNASRVAELENNLTYAALQAGDVELARSTAALALSSARERGDHYTSSAILHNLALASLLDDSPDDARRFLSEAIVIARRHELQAALATYVEATAALAVQVGAQDIGAQLLGASAAVRRPAGPVEDRVRAQAERRLRANVGDERFAQAYGAGRLLELDRAAVLALDWLHGRSASDASLMVHIAAGDRAD
jgi:predicted ATPase